MAETQERNFDSMAEEAVGGVEIEDRVLTDKEVERLADVCVEFAMKMTGIDLYPYEKEFAWRIAHSLLLEDAEELSALFARQGGKTETVAVIVCGLMVLLPVIAKAVPGDERVSKFDRGLHVGIYGPTYEQAGIMWARMRARLYSSSSKQMLLDPDINIDLGMTKTENMTLPNGSFVDCGTASPQAKIEGKTYHLLLLEECQDIPTAKIRASIHPMAAATAGTLVKIGTPNKIKSDFYETCRRNKRADVNRGLVRSKKRCHFEFDYTVVQRFNPKYRKYVSKERDRLGEESDDFKMKYKLHWLLERGMFINQDLFDECGIRDHNNNIEVWKGSGKRRKKFIFVRPPNVITFDSGSENMVAAIDVGREASTIVTVGRVFWDGGVDYGGQLRYPLHIANWLELFGDDHESQYPQIVEFLKNYNISQAVVDATGKGDPVYSRLAAELDKFDITVYPFIFSASSKDVGYKVFLQEISTRRFTYPAGHKATRLQKWKRFIQQMYDLEKDWRGQVMVVQKPKGEDSRDDYPDSAMMLCWLVNVRGTMEIEDAPNPFFKGLNRASRWQQADMIKEAGAWFRRKISPRGRLHGHRPGKNGRWDA